MNFIELDQYHQIDNLRSDCLITMHQLQKVINNNYSFQCFVICFAFPIIVLIQILTMLYVDEKYKKLKKRLYHVV